MPAPISAEIRAYRPAPGLLNDRVVLVTGASGAIGGALARACADLGARVILNGRSVKKLEHLYDAIIDAGAPRPSIAPLDFEKADATSYESLAAAIGQEFGRLDGLAHVGGLLGDRSPIAHYDVPTFMKVMHVNVTAPFILTKTLLPLLQQSADPSIVFTTSGVSVKGRAYWGAYAVSKFADEGLMQVLADELATDRPIRSNSVNPGPVRSAMRAKAYPAEDASKLAAPQDVLEPFLYLLGPDSRGVTGCRFDAQP
ncbi:MAG TPA: YciK family oxidoreductase [Steroidobacteraceae bacterium]|nr:YciK family oxidoreductase [Steroidobacteraceae bacterium]